MKYRKICKICLGRGTVADIKEIGRIGKLHFGWTKKVPLDNSGAPTPSATGISSRRIERMPGRLAVKMPVTFGGLDKRRKWCKTFVRLSGFTRFCFN